jgi:2-hydroxychromene-2-carboxylate isomerase
VPFVMNPHFMLNSLPAMRGAIWASRNGQIEAYDLALFEAAWAKARNISDLAELSAIVSEAGLDAKSMAEGIQTDEVKRTLIEQTNQAVERGAFGAPAFFVGDEMHFGQDRLPWIERALAPG